MRVWYGWVARKNMTFDDILEQAITLLKRQGRISYSALRRRFDLDDAYLEDLREVVRAYQQTCAEVIQRSAIPAHGL